MATESENKGALAAARDIQQGTPKLYWQYRNPWGDFAVELFRTRFGVELEWINCFVTEEDRLYRGAYNGAIERYVDQLHGEGAVQAARDEVEQYRMKLYKAYEDRLQQDEAEGEES